MDGATADLFGAAPTERVVYSPANGSRIWVEFEVAGKPVPKARPRTVTKDKFGRPIPVRTFTAETTARYENLVAWEARKALGGRDPTDLPVALNIQFAMPIPRSWSKKRQNAAALQQIQVDKKPDLTNLVKAVEDGCNGVVWRDDSQVVSLHVSKVYGLRPGASIGVVLLG